MKTMVDVAVAPQEEHSNMIMAKHHGVRNASLWLTTIKTFALIPWLPQAGCCWTNLCRSTIGLIQWIQGCCHIHFRILQFRYWPFKIIALHHSLGTSRAEVRWRTHPSNVEAILTATSLAWPRGFIPHLVILTTVGAWHDTTMRQQKHRGNLRWQKNQNIEHVPFFQPPSRFFSWGPVVL